VEYTLAEIVTIRAKPEDVQAQLIDNLIHNEQSWTKRTDEQWKVLQQSIHWLHSQSGVMQKLSMERMDTMILSAILDSAGFSSS
jgi:Secretory pathway protein Sec39